MAAKTKFKINDRVCLSALGLGRFGIAHDFVGTVVGKSRRYPKCVRIHKDGHAETSVDTYHEEFLTMHVQKFNPKLTPRVRKRAPLENGYIEGEHFHDPAPDMMHLRPMSGANPTEQGWYLAVSRYNGSLEHKPEIEPVVVVWNSDRTRLIVHEAGDGEIAELSAFYWVAGMVMPDIYEEEEQ